LILLLAGLALAFAPLLAARALVALLPGGREGTRAHATAGVAIIETLDLRSVQPGSWHLTCLPLRIPGADGAPARALLSR